MALFNMSFQHTHVRSESFKNFKPSAFCKEKDGIFYFYKSQGGRNNHFTLKLELTQMGRMLHGLTPMIRVALYQDQDGERFHDQQIMNVCTQHGVFRDGVDSHYHRLKRIHVYPMTNGRFSCRVRIEDISKAYDDKTFRIGVTLDSQTMYSKPVYVLTKNRLQRMYTERSQESEDSDDYARPYKRRKRVMESNDDVVALQRLLQPFLDMTPDALEAYCGFVQTALQKVVAVSAE